MAEVKYPFYTNCINNPNGEKGSLGFDTEELAQYHCDLMNASRLNFEHDPTWNKDFWKEPPLEWVILNGQSKNT